MWKCTFVICNLIGTPDRAKHQKTYDNFPHGRYQALSTHPPFPRRKPGNKATVPDPKLVGDRKLSLGTRLYALIASCCLSGMIVWVRIHYLCYPHTLCNEQPLNARWRHCCYDNVYYTHCLPNLQTSWRQMRLGSQQLCTPLSPEALFINKVCGLLMRNHSRLMTFQLDL